MKSVKLKGSVVPLLWAAQNNRSKLVGPTSGPTRLILESIRHVVLACFVCMGSSGFLSRSAAGTGIDFLGQNSKEISPASIKSAELLFLLNFSVSRKRRSE